MLAGFKRGLTVFIADEEGITTVEYALLLALMVVAAIGVWSSFGARVRQAIEEATNAFDDAGGTT